MLSVQGWNPRSHWNHTILCMCADWDTYQTASHTYMSPLTTQNNSSYQTHTRTHTQKTVSEVSDMVYQLRRPTGYWCHRTFNLYSASAYYMYQQNLTQPWQPILSWEMIHYMDKAIYSEIYVLVSGLLVITVNRMFTVFCSYFQIKSINK
jgi:hypothetical protein